jgi:KaiC/GvpD/RAD55 family RecA-like ATPase
MVSGSGAISKMGRGEIMLVLTSANRYSSILPVAVSALVKKKSYGIYVTVNKPYTTLREDFRRKGIDMERLFFIDAVTKMVGGASAPSKNFIAIESPQFLTEMSIAISQAMSALPKGDRFLILDSVSSMLIYNSAGTVARFMHFLSGKLREWGVRGVFMAVDTDVETLLPYITQFVDKTVRIR